MWLRFDEEADLKVNCSLAWYVNSAILWPRQVTGHQGQASPHQENAFVSSVSLLDDIMVRLAVTRKLIRAI